MTANELADELDKMIPALPLTVLIKSATMLRQQQAEIEALRNHRAWIKETAVKELTDEEIEDIASQHLTAHAEFIGAGGCHVEGDITFARAILQKASEQ